MAPAIGAPAPRKGSGPLFCARHVLMRCARARQATLCCGTNAVHSRSRLSGHTAKTKRHPCSPVLLVPVAEPLSPPTELEEALRGGLIPTGGMQTGYVKAANRGAFGEQHVQLAPRGDRSGPV